MGHPEAEGDFRLRLSGVKGVGAVQRWGALMPVLLPSLLDTAINNGNMDSFAK